MMNQEQLSPASPDSTSSMNDCNTYYVLKEKFQLNSSRYELIEPIGVGSQCVVAAAKDTKIQNQQGEYVHTEENLVAIKKIYRAFSHKTTDFTIQTLR